MITRKNIVNQPIKFAASTGFLFTLGRTISMTMTVTYGLQVLKNINMGNNRIINLPAPVDTTDCATKPYCDLNILKSGGTLTGNVYVGGSTRNISVGCNNLGADNYFRFHSGCEAINITTDSSNFNLFAPRIIITSAETDLNVVVIDSVGITFRNPMYMANNRILDLDTNVSATDAVNK